MTALIHLPCRDADGNPLVVVETPRGSPVKISYDVKLDAFLFKRPLPLGMSYPHDWGFVPSTCADDGDPLDAMVIFDSATWPGTVIPSRAIGIVRMTQKEGRGKRVQNDRVIALPIADDRYHHANELSPRLHEELERFFVKASELTGKEVRIEGWDGPKAASKAIERAARAYMSGKSPR